MSANINSKLLNTSTNLLLGGGLEQTQQTRLLFMLLHHVFLGLPLLLGRFLFFLGNRIWLGAGIEVLVNVVYYLVLILVQSFYVAVEFEKMSGYLIL